MAVPAGMTYVVAGPSGGRATSATTGNDQCAAIRSRIAGMTRSGSRSWVETCATACSSLRSRYRASIARVRVATCPSRSSFSSVSSLSVDASFRRASSSVSASTSTSRSPDTPIGRDRSPVRITAACRDSCWIGATTERDSARASSRPISASITPAATSPRRAV